MKLYITHLLRTTRNQYNGRGKFSRKGADVVEALAAEFDRQGIKYIRGNDSRRGGWTGQFIRPKRISVIAFLRKNPHLAQGQVSYAEFSALVDWLDLRVTSRKSLSGATEYLSANNGTLTSARMGG